jgi:hypothetical protein
MTTTLQAIGVTLAGGSITLGMALLVFGRVLRNDKYSVFLAPRCVARPRKVIFHALSSMQQQEQEKQEQSQQQLQEQCGGPTNTTTSTRSISSWSCCMVNICCSCWSLLTWIPWVLSLDYHTLLDGVPGTGTRQHGQTGSLLKCQLDAIVMLRFHAIGLKLSLLVTVLCLFIVLPVYWNSECYFQYDSLPGCQQHSSSTTTTVTTATLNSNNSTSSTLYHHYLTNYGRTTIANVPSLGASAGNENEYPDQDSDHDPQTIILVKLYAVCIIFGIISAYWIHLIHDEWIQILAMRRVYYLEHDVWGERKRELQSITEVATAAGAACTNTDATEQQAQQLQQQQQLHTKREEPTPDPPTSKSAAAYYSSSSFFTLPRLTSSSSKTLIPEHQQQVQTLDSLSMSKSQILPPLRPRSNSTCSGMMKKIEETLQPPQQQHDNAGNNTTNINTSRRSHNSSGSSSSTEPHLRHRDPWVPHPEQRDTVPNVSLYSVLVGGLPSLPEEAIEYHRRSAAAASAVAAAVAAGQQQADHEQQLQRPDEEDDEEEDDTLYVYCKKRYERIIACTLSKSWRCVLCVFLLIVSHDGEIF